METTTLRVRKTTQEKLRKLSATERLSMMQLIDNLVEEHEKSFWKGFENEAAAFLDQEEKNARKTFEGSLGDDLAK